MRKGVRNLFIVCITAMLFLTSFNIDVFANMSAMKYGSVSEAKLIEVDHKYTFTMKKNQILWLKVPVKSLVKKQTHIKVETSGVSNKISAYYNKKKAQANETEVEYSAKSSPLSYPIAWKNDYYYVKIKATGKGKLTYKVRCINRDPKSPQYEDEFCTTEAMAFNEESILSMLDGLRTIRDEVLEKSTIGQAITDYYYDISKGLSVKLLSDDDFRSDVVMNAKKLMPMVQALIKISEGESSDYIIKQSDYYAMVKVKKLLMNKLDTQQCNLGENLWDKLAIKDYIGLTLTDFVQSRLMVSSYRLTNHAYSEYIVKYSGSENISTLLKKVNKVFTQNQIPVSISAKESEDLFGTDKKYILKVVGCNDETLVSNLLKKMNVFDQVSVNYQTILLTNDIQYDFQWYLDNDGQKIPHNENGTDKYIKGKKDADIRYEGMRNYMKTKKTTNTVVAVIDTGINYELADFKGIVDMKKAYNFVSNNKDPMDDNNHGTHVSGIIAAQAGNGYSMAGITSDVTILPIKVLDENGSGDTNDLAKAIKYAVDKGADVINLSLGMRKSNGNPVLPKDCADVEEAMKYAKKKKVTIIAAAGNEDKNNLSYPANSKYVISVGAINNKDKLASFTNTGEGLDLVAPGVAIASLIKNGEVAILNGTSMAAPIVTAVVANMYSLDANLNFDRVMAILKQSCRDLGEKGYDKKFGYGCINASKAVKNVAKKVKSLKLSSTSKTMKKGDQTTLKVTIQPSDAVNKELQWTSSNKKVVTVNSKGKITAVGKGTATITATTKDGSKKTVSCKITVKK